VGRDSVTLIALGAVHPFIAACALVGILTVFIRVTDGAALQARLLAVAGVIAINTDLNLN
jgi:hypothetical protein